MADWVTILERARTYLDAGEPKAASDIYRAGLEVYQNDQTASGWLMFNLMLSEATQRGFEAARDYLVAIIDSNVSWNAKLYTLEMALSSATQESDNLTGLYADSLHCIRRYIAIDAGPDDINIMSCQEITRHIYRLFAAHPLDPCLQIITSENRYTPTYQIAPRSHRPTLPDMYNRLPTVVERSYDQYNTEIRPLGFRCIGRAYILRLGNNTVLFDAEGFPLETPYGPLPVFLHTVLQRAFAGAKVTNNSQPGVSLFVGDYFSQTLNYCHWLLDGMPRILAAEAAGLRCDYIVGAFEETTAFQSQTLAKLLCEGQKYIGLTDKDGLLAFDDLYYADNASLLHIHHPLYNADINLVDRLRSRLKKNVCPVSAGRRLYVPRKHNRIVLNEAALIELLKNYNFECIDTDALDFEQQVMTFARAEAVVAPHGAALSNLLFSPPGCRVLEFFPPFGGSASFYRLAAACGHNYACFIDDKSLGSNRDCAEGIINNTTGIEVDLSFVKEWLDRKLYRTPTA